MNLATHGPRDYKLLVANENPTGTEPPGAASPAPNSLLTALREHRVYRVALGYTVGAWVILQVAAIVLPGFAAPPWILRGLMILLALGFGAALLAGWGYDRRASGRPLLPRASGGRLAWVITALLPVALVLAFFLLRPMPAQPVSVTPSADHKPANPPVPLAPEKSIAVLPFENLSDDKANGFFTDGVQDEILTDLAKVADLKVISRTSVMQYRDATRNLPEIGRALGVAFVVEGSVQRASNKIRVSAQLIDARTDIHRWADTYDRDLSDVFAIQSDIAKAIAGQLQAVISPQEHSAMEEAPTHDLKAYELYLRAVELWNSIDEPSLDVSVRTAALLQAATTRDPSFARAYAFLADVQGQHFRYFETTPAQDARVRATVETVARLQPGSGDAHRAEGTYAYSVRHDYQRAREEFTATTHLSPNDSTAIYYLALTDRRQGRWDDALSHVRQAMALDPESVDNISALADIQAQTGRYAEAIAGLDRWIAAHPQAFWAYLDKAKMLLDWQASPEAALRELARVPPDFDPNGTVTAARLTAEFCQRDFAAAEHTLAAYPLPEINAGTPDAITVPRAFDRGRLARYQGDEAGARVAFNEARTILADRVKARPMDAGLLLYLATADAALGHVPEALEEGRRGAAMQPPDADATDGPGKALLFAGVLAWSGEIDEAIRQLQTLAAKPNGPGYGLLKLHPDWDPLRTDPRFAALVTSLAPASRLSP